MKFLTDEEIKKIYAEYHFAQEEILGAAQEEWSDASLSFDTFDEKSEAIMDKFRSALNMSEDMCRAIIEKCPGLLTNNIYKSKVRVYTMYDYEDYELKLKEITEEKSRGISFTEIFLEDEKKLQPCEQPFDENIKASFVQIAARTVTHEEQQLTSTECYVYIPKDRKEVIAA